MGFLIVIGVVFLVAIVLLVLGLSSKPTGQALVEERLGDRPLSLTRPRRESQDGPGFVSTAVDRAVAGRGFAANLATQLAQANLKWTVGEFLVVTLLISLSLGLAAYAIQALYLHPHWCDRGVLPPSDLSGLAQVRTSQGVQQPVGRFAQPDGELAARGIQHDAGAGSHLQRDARPHRGGVWSCGAGAAAGCGL